MAEPCYHCDGDGYDPFIDGKSAGNCKRCHGGGTERPPCDICGEASVTHESALYPDPATGYVESTYFCAACADKVQGE